MTLESSPDFSRSLLVNYFMDEADRRLAFRLFKLSLIQVEHDHIHQEHSHYFYEIIIPVQRGYHCSLNHQKLEVSPGQALLVHSEDVHSDHYISGSELLFIQFYIDDMFGKPWNHGIMAKNLTPEKRIIALPPEDEISSLIELVLHHRRDNASRLIATGKLCEAIIRDLIGLIPENLLGTKFSDTMKNDEFIRNIESYFHSHIHRKLDVKALCRHLGMSRRAMEKKFSESFHDSPLNCFVKLKIKIAIEILRTGKSIKEAARQLGFKDQFYFSSTFKRTTGYPPSQYPFQ